MRASVSYSIRQCRGHNAAALAQVCARCSLLGGSAPSLSAKGTNIQWYKDSLLTNSIAGGNNFQPNSTKTDTFYVTQTVDNLQSWPKQVIIYFSSLLPFSIEHKNDSLLAPASVNYNYQWYFNNAHIPDSAGGKQYAIKLDTSGSFKVVVTDHNICRQEAS